MGSIITAPIATPPEPYTPSSQYIPALVNAPVIFEAVPALAGYPSVPELWLVISNADENFGGSQVYMSIDGGVSYRLVGGTAGNAVTGVLADDWDAEDDPDTTNDLLLDVSESNGVLESRSAAERDQFVFPCYVEGGPAGDGITPPVPYELMTYRTATLTGPDAYTLDATDTLRRAAFGAPTVGAGIAHTTGQRFALLSPEGTGILKLPIPGLLGVTLKFKIVALNQFHGGAQSLADVVAYSFTPTGSGAPGNQENYLVYGGVLTQPVSTFDVELAAADVEFSGRKVRYNARTFTVPDPGIGMSEVYHVSIEDRNAEGDSGVSTNLTAFCEASLDRVGVSGYTYLGSIEVTHDGPEATTTPGGGLAAASLRQI